MADEIEMKEAQAKSKSKKSGQAATKAVRAATLEEIVHLTGKDPLIAFAEAACGRLECTGCNGAGDIERPSLLGPSQATCERCQGTKREKVPSTAIARYKLATFFCARKAVETSGPEGEPLERFLIVKFAG